jgi:hypothetical protein
MSELKEVIFQHFEEAKQYIDRMNQKHDKQDDKRREVLYSLKQAYDSKDEQRIAELEQELKEQYEIFEYRRKEWKHARDNVFNPALNNVLSYIDKECGYPPRILKP